MVEEDVSTMALVTRSRSRRVGSSPSFFARLNTRCLTSARYSFIVLDQKTVEDVSRHVSSHSDLGSPRVSTLVSDHCSQLAAPFWYSRVARHSLSSSQTAEDVSEL